MVALDASHARAAPAGQSIQPLQFTTPLLAGTQRVARPRQVAPRDSAGGLVSGWRLEAARRPVGRTGRRRCASQPRSEGGAAVCSLAVRGRGSIARAVVYYYALLSTAGTRLSAHVHGNAQPSPLPPRAPPSPRQAAQRRRASRPCYQAVRLPVAVAQARLGPGARPRASSSNHGSTALLAKPVSVDVQAASQRPRHLPSRPATSRNVPLSAPSLRPSVAPYALRFFCGGLPTPSASSMSASSSSSSSDSKSMSLRASCSWAWTRQSRPR